MKRFFILSAIMLLMATEASAQRTIVAGDTDGDGVLTIGDVTS